MNYITEQIISSVSMRDIAEQYGLDVTRKGVMMCPFHKEKTASLKLYPENRGWYCFGCGAGGSVIDFIRRYFNLSFMEAVSKINNDFGLGLESSNYHTRRKIEQESRGAVLDRIRKKMLREKYEAVYKRVKDYYRQCWLRLKVCPRPSKEYFLLSRRVEYMDYWFDANKTFEMWEVNR